MALRFFILLCFQLGFSQTQDTINSQEQTSNKASILKPLIDGNSQIKEIKPLKDSLTKRTLEDNKLASEFDQKWLNEKLDRQLVN